MRSSCLTFTLTVQQHLQQLPLSAAMLPTIHLMGLVYAQRLMMPLTDVNIP